MKINVKINVTPLVWARLIIMSVSSLLLIGLLFFLYQDFYQTIIQAEAVLVLKREVALRDIEMDLFRRVQAVHEYKIGNRLPVALTDVFGTSPAPAPNHPPLPGALTPAEPTNLFPF